MGTRHELASWLRQQTEAVESMQMRAGLLRAVGLDRLNAPVPGHWSALGCVEHVCAVGRPYEVILNAAVTEAPAAAPDMPISYRRFAVTLLWASGPDGPTWVPAPPAAVPQECARTLGTLDEFDAHLMALHATLRLSHARDLVAKPHSTPAVKFLRLTAAEMLGLLIGHAERHLRQAERAAAR